MLAQALFASLGGGTTIMPVLTKLASPASLATANAWGLAIRFGQRLSGGTAGPLQRSSLAMDAQTLTLRLAAADRPLYGETVERRHGSLAALLGRSPAISD